MLPAITLRKAVADRAVNRWRRSWSRSALGCEIDAAPNLDTVCAGRRCLAQKKFARWTAVGAIGAIGLTAVPPSDMLVKFDDFTPCLDGERDRKTKT